MLTPLVAGVLSALSLSYALWTWRRCARLSGAALIETDPLELRLAQKELALQLALGVRTVRALARATLFAGTGLAVWALTGGSAHYLEAGICFILGFCGWAACGEVERRIGPLAKAGRGRGLS